MNPAMRFACSPLIRWRAQVPQGSGGLIRLRRSKSQGGVNRRSDWTAFMRWGRVFQALIVLAHVGLPGSSQATAPRPSLVGFVPGVGTAGGVAVQGNIAYVASQEFGLSIVDVSNPSKPAVLGTSNVRFFGQHVAVAGSLAVLTSFSTSGSGAELWVLDVTRPSAPTVLGGLTTNVNGIAAFSGVALNSAGTLGVVSLGAGGIWTVDLSNPANPALFPGGNLAIGGFAEGVALGGNSAYVADGANGLAVVDVSNPAAPRMLGNKSLSGSAGVAVAGNLAYVADSSAGDLSVLDVSKPGAPALLGSVALGGPGTYVAVSGTQAAVLVFNLPTAETWLQIVDVSAPSNPRVTGSVSLGVFSAKNPTTGQGRGVAMNAGIAYAGVGPYGLEICGTSGSGALLGKFQNSFRLSSLAMANGMAFAAGAPGTVLEVPAALLEVVNIAIPGKPSIVGTLSASAYLAFYGVAVNSAGTLGVVSLGADGIWTVDLSNPANPALVPGGHLALSGLAQGVALSGNFAYVADYAGGLVVVDVSNPAAPKKVASGSAGSSVDVAVAGSLAYVADQAGDLSVLDVSKPGAPALLGRVALSGMPRHVAVAGGQAAVVSANGGNSSFLQIVDVSAPSTPRLVGTATIGVPGVALGVAMTPGFALVTSGGVIDPSSQWLQIFDVSSNPATPVMVNQAQLTGIALGAITVQGGMAAVTDFPATVDIVSLGSGGSAVPVITSGLSASVKVGAAFSYQITATNSPATFNAVGLPSGLSVNTATGLISGTPSVSGTFSVTLSATNASGTGGAALALTINPASASTPAISARVYPNPWRSDKHAGLPIAFDQLTGNITIKIFTLSGHLVRTLTTNTGSVTWDRANDTGEAVASGLYLYLITDDQGHKTTGKFAIIK